MSLLTIRHLSYKIGNKTLLKDIDWQIEAGENWCVFGLNGSGKTTLLSVASGYLPAADGTVSLLGEALTAENRQRLCAQVGFVSDAFFTRYYQRESVLDVVLAGYDGGLGLKSDFGEAAKLRRAKQLLRVFGLAKLCRKPFVLLSKGEQQKVLLTRALLKKPQLLFLDEPCSGLDVLSRLQVLALFRELAEHEQITLVCVTHHFDELLDIYDQALLLRRGAVHSLGARQTVFAEENFSDFLGSRARVRSTSEGTFHMQLTDHEQRLKIVFEEQRREGHGISS